MATNGRHRRAVTVPDQFGFYSIKLTPIKGHIELFKQSWIVEMKRISKNHDNKTGKCRN